MDRKGRKKQKTDEDEEAKGFVEMQALKDNETKIDVLHKNVSAIKQLTTGISNQIGEDDKVIGSLNQGFDRSKDLVKRTLSQMDSLVERASGSMTTYVILFVIVIGALMVKFL